jgi:integrase
MSARPRKNGLWEARVDHGWQNGKRVRKSLYAKTRRELVEKLKAEQTKAGLGVAHAGRMPTLGAFLESWLENNAQPKLKLSTYIRYRELSRLHIIPGLGRFPLDKLTVAQVQEFLNARAKSGMAAQTVHHLRAVLRTALNQAIRARVISFNAAGLADSPRITPREPTYLKPDEARVFLQAAAQDRLGALYFLAFATGVRQGEALALRWEDVDLDHGTVTIGHTARRMRIAPGQPTQLIISDTKTAASRRVIPIPNFVVAALRHQRERQMFERRAAQDNWQETGFVFTKPNGQPVEAEHLARSFATLLRRNSLGRMRWHDLRHSAITIMLAAGVPPRTVMQYAGHSNLATTMNIYAHVSPQMLGEASEAMQRLFGTTS